MPWLFLLLSLAWAWFTYNAYYPQYRAPTRATVSFFAGWLTTELALHHIAWQAVLVLLLTWAGALQAWPGKVAVLITVISWAGLWYCFWSMRGTAALVDDALRAGLGPGYRQHILPAVSAKLATGVEWKEIALPFPMRHRDVERIRDIQYTRAGGLNLKLDVYRHRSRPTDCPTLLQIHGGAWTIGSKNEQGVPLMLHLAARGWVCVSADYRLSPHATFPDHLTDLKRAVQWIHTHGREYGANPEFLLVTGGSAGGHLASLLALTANDPAYQPGFEDVDTAVQGCVSFYGVYDFIDRHHLLHHQGMSELLEKRVMKAAVEEAPEAYAKASPIDQIHADAPPFFVVHGTHDTLVPVAQAREFCNAFRASARAPLVYVEVPGAQHAFDIFPSLRTTHVIHGVERFLAYLYSQYLMARGGATEAPPQAAAG